MAHSLLRSFVSGTRQVLTAQLFVSIAAVGLAGWTLSVTNELIRERDLLREQVIQLQNEMAARGIVVPATPTVVGGTPARGETAYPGEIGLTEDMIEAPPPERAAADGETQAPDIVAADPPAPPPATRTPDRAAPPAAAERDIGRVIGDLFAPPPQMRVIVLHVRSDLDARAARRIAAELQRAADVRVLIDVMPPRDPRQSGYAYFDGRQSRAAAALVTQFHDIARTQGVAQWSAQLRGVALPAQGEYTADRLDIVLPPLPESAPADPVR